MQPHEAVPDTSAFTPTPNLPPLLTFCDGRQVTSHAEWQQRRAEIRQLICHYFLGRFPNEAPALKNVRVLQEERVRGAVNSNARLTFDTEPEVSFAVEVMTPEGDGPFPVLLTQSNHRRWGLVALSRGYQVCIYPGADVDDQTERLRLAYPECDWALIPQRAWLGSRALDYMLTLEQAHKEQIAITGHSRNGKQSLIAAAFDERITAVVSSSSGSPGACPYRFTSEFTFAESPAFFPEPWFHPRLRSFIGREHELPIDAHGLVGLIAPRHCLLSTAHNDGCEPTFAVEQCYLEGQKAYQFLGQPEALRIRWRQGAHETLSQDIHSYFDWFDLAFDRDPQALENAFPETLIHQFNWQGWRADAGIQESTPLLTKTSSEQVSVCQRIEWMLGERPPAGVGWGGRYDAIAESHAALMTHDRWDPGGITRIPINFGEDIAGNLYYQKDAEGPMPVVIWLHPYSYHSGYNEGYGVQHTTIYHHLAQEGFLVLAYDQLGFGLRLLEGRDFYPRYPRWSRLGKMISDVRSAVDFLLTHTQSKDPVTMPSINATQIYCLGYSLGGTVGLYATALDGRIAGVASFCGFTPMRTDTDDKFTGGIRRLWESHALLPKLGLFHGRESEIPYDYHDLLGMIAPRACLVVAPTRDREADAQAVTHCVEQARQASTANGTKPHLDFVAPDDYNRFQWDQHAMFLEWIRQVDG